MLCQYASKYCRNNWVQNVHIFVHHHHHHNEQLELSSALHLCIWRITHLFCNVTYKICLIKIIHNKINEKINKINVAVKSINKQVSLFR